MSNLETLKEIFKEHGLLSSMFPTYKPRPGQIALAEAVDASIHLKTHLLAEGPTGTGKSLAYGIPAALHALNNCTTVVIVTANIPLQEQLFRKDLPLIAMLMSQIKKVDGSPRFSPLRFVLAKGMANYVCRHKLHEMRTSELRDQDWFKNIDLWSQETDTGDKSELVPEPKYDEWEQVSSDSENCLGREKCNYFDSGCYGRAARGKNSQVHIVITNYHMLYTDFMVRNSSDGEASLLPPYGILIMDEAHRAVDIAMDFHGHELGPKRIFKTLKGVGKLPGVESFTKAVKSSCDVFFDHMKKYRSSAGDDIIKVPIGSDFGLVEDLDSLANFIRVTAKSEYAKGKVSDVNLERLLMKAGSIIKLTKQLTVLCDGEEGTNALPEHKVYFVEKGSTGYCQVKCKVVDVRDYFRTNIFEPLTLIAVSATLSTPDPNDYGGDRAFKFIAQQMGLNPGEHKQLIAPSPFDGARVGVIIPNPFPEPSEPSHSQSVARVVEAVANKLGGRTLALFTSTRAMMVADEYLKNRLPGIRVLTQGNGELGRTSIIESFKKDPAAVILGTASFWEGVDIPGQALTALVIDKLPFLPPTDPVLKYFDELYNREGGSAFFDYSIPKALLALKQGVGRLIRTESDYGVVVLCDKRVTMKNYGVRFQKASFPAGCQWTTTIDDMDDFLGYWAETNERLEKST
jgi:ATP-dependent DNA helicase DinG